MHGQPTIKILRIIQRDSIISVCRSSLFLLSFNDTLILSTDFRKKKKHSNIRFHESAFSGSRRVVPRGRTDMSKLILVVDFRNFMNAPNNRGYGAYLHTGR